MANINLAQIEYPQPPIRSRRLFIAPQFALFLKQFLVYGVIVHTTAMIAFVGYLHQYEICRILWPVFDWPIVLLHPLLNVIDMNGVIMAYLWLGLVFLMPPLIWSLSLAIVLWLACGVIAGFADSRSNQSTICSCGRSFECGAATGSCWCFALPNVAPVPGSEMKCECAECLKKKINDRSIKVAQAARLRINIKYAPIHTNGKKDVL